MGFALICLGGGSSVFAAQPDVHSEALTQAIEEENEAWMRLGDELGKLDPSLSQKIPLSFIMRKSNFQLAAEAMNLIKLLKINEDRLIALEKKMADNLRQEGRATREAIRPVRYLGFYHLVAACDKKCAILHRNRLVRDKKASKLIIRLCGRSTQDFRNNTTPYDTKIKIWNQRIEMIELPIKIKIERDQLNRRILKMKPALRVAFGDYLQNMNTVGMIKAQENEQSRMLCEAVLVPSSDSDSSHLELSLFDYQR